MEALPEDVLLELFEYLPATAVSYCAGVCRSWHAVAYSMHVWKKSVERDFPVGKGSKKGDSPSAMSRRFQLFKYKAMCKKLGKSSATDEVRMDDEVNWRELYVFLWQSANKYVIH